MDKKAREIKKETTPKTMDAAGKHTAKGCSLEKMV